MICKIAIMFGLKDLTVSPGREATVTLVLT